MNFYRMLLLSTTDKFDPLGTKKNLKTMKKNHTVFLFPKENPEPRVQLQDLKIRDSGGHELLTLYSIAELSRTPWTSILTELG